MRSDKDYRSRLAKRLRGKSCFNMEFTECDKRCVFWKGRKIGCTADRDNLRRFAPGAPIFKNEKTEEVKPEPKPQQKQVVQPKQAAKPVTQPQVKTKVPF